MVDKQFVHWLPCFGWGACTALIHASQCFHAVVASIWGVRLGWLGHMHDEFHVQHWSMLPSASMLLCMTSSMGNTNPCFPVAVARACATSSIVRMQNVYLNSLSKHSTFGRVLAYQQSGLGFKSPPKLSNFSTLSLLFGLSKINLGPNVAKSINTHGQTVNPWRK